MYLLDTSVFSLLNRQSPLAELYMDELESGHPLLLPLQAVAELYFGATLKK